VAGDSVTGELPFPQRPTLSIIVPVYREAERIGPALRLLREYMPAAEVEIILVDGSPEQETLAAAQGLDAHKIVAPLGRSIQMNAGAAQSRGEALLFLHADTLLPENALSLIQETLTEPDVAAGAFSLRIDSRSRLVRLFGRLSCLRSKMTSIPFGDQAIFLRRDLFFELGGFAPIPLMEDVEFMRRLKRKKLRVRVLKAVAITSGRRWEREGAFFCTLRNITLRVLFALGVDPARLARHYPSPAPTNKIRP
jgi:rSAM/selenodomain-associated transferase 2